MKTMGTEIKPAFDPNTTTINEEGTRALYAACQDAFVWLVDLRAGDKLLTALVQERKAGDLADLLHKLHTALEAARSGERKLPRVLVEVLGGIADIYADKGVNVMKVDYDDGQSVPVAFQDLSPARSGK